MGEASEKTPRLVRGVFFSASGGVNRLTIKAIRTSERHPLVLRPERLLRLPLRQSLPGGSFGIGRHDEHVTVGRVRRGAGSHGRAR